ncbi:MAG TPA: indole-3-glycerol phosphate synthase TrpC [Candidatus Hydrogenedentes bacterium]|nr:indole-3-glycerol phosphate synthase TrpC [Candidatus Hydrogenedentota bacterium]
MILDRILEDKRAEVDAHVRAVPVEILRERAANANPPRDFPAALRRDGISLIAEIKRASPSRGDILPGADAALLATQYEVCGARAISVLTDTRYFKGSLEDLAAARRRVQAPCLRKEFIIDPYQIVEARSAGADAVLLIVRILSDAQLRDFLAATKSLGMGALVEVHTEREMARAVDAGAHIIGINNRDLDTLTIDLDCTFRLQRMAPPEVVLVSESGIHSREDVLRLEEAGIDAMLVGESLLTSGDVPGKIRELLGRHEN